ncbi:hypothetical protein EC919_102435 [Pseudomonas graminis]|uniref:AlgP family protein n=1 Tax=Pseudomonas graminis TaxID=158627 RepID=UPI0010E4CBCA|nr:AlgP family protein [Pseudomonas graminis]TDV57061.1 hypothetical protein EC919_102435 [Pseudomonas graminis]
MASRKKIQLTPLLLLQELTTILLEHFEQACGQALADAEKKLSRFEKKRNKVEKKLGKQRDRLDYTPNAKRKKQTKLRATLSRLEAALVELQLQIDETRHYISHLKHDIHVSLTLLQGVGKVREVASEMLRQREDGGSSPAAQMEVAAPSAVKPSPASLRAAKQATALKAIANAVVAKPTVTVVKARKHAPGEVAPLAHGIAEASAAPDSA